jgi:hypothetical protein
MSDEERLFALQTVPREHLELAAAPLPSQAGPAEKLKLPPEDRKRATQCCDHST